MKLSNRIKTCFTLLAGLAVIALLVGCASAPNQNPSGLGTFAYNLRFPGQYYDAESGNNYNYFRDYDPSIGRYIESDPIGLAGGVNTYAYVSSNTLVSGDSLGLQEVPILLPEELPILSPEELPALLKPTEGMTPEQYADQLAKYAQQQQQGWKETIEQDPYKYARYPLTDQQEWWQSLLENSAKLSHPFVDFGPKTIALPVPCPPKHVVQPSDDRCTPFGPYSYCT